MDITRWKRVSNAVRESIPRSLHTIVWLLKLILPISLAVQLLQYSGLLEQISVILNPVFKAVGLPGSSSISFVCSIFLPLYAPIAIISTIGLNVRQMTILAMMCLISHNTFVESAVQKRTGSSYLFVLFLRISMSIVAAFLWNAFLPKHMGDIVPVSVEHLRSQGILEVILLWAEGAISLSIKMTLIVTGLMILQKILEEFNIMDSFAKSLSPFMRFMGLSESSSFLWLVAYVLGLTYGSAIMIDQVEEGKIRREDAKMLNNHLAISHSFLEDTLLFVSIGAPLFWITVPRLLLAVVVVWIIKIFSSLFEKIRTTELP